MPSKTVKLQTNLPLIGTVSRVYFHHNQKAKDEGWAPQLKLVGTWDEEGEGSVYLPLRLAEDMHKAGFLAIETGPECDLYRVMTPNTKIGLLKEEDGTKRFIRFSFADKAPRLGLGSPEKGGDPGNAFQEREVAQRATNTIPPDLAIPLAAKTLQEMQAKDSMKDKVGAVTRFHLGCMALSAHNHVLLYTCPLKSLDSNAVHAGGFTIMKKLEEQGIVTFTEKQLKSIRDTLGTASHDAREASNYKDWPEDKPEEGP